MKALDDSGQLASGKVPSPGRVSCLDGGNHHTWLWGQCQNCGLVRRKFVKAWTQGRLDQRTAKRHALKEARA